MIKAWLLVFLFNPVSGEFQEKIEVPYMSMNECKLHRSLYKPKGKVKAVTVCVTDDHYHGRSIDPNVPLEL